MDRTRDKNLIIEPNAAMPGRKYSEEKPWLPSFHMKDLLGGLVTALIFRLILYYKSKNAKKFRHGEEYGSARWSA